MDMNINLNITATEICGAINNLANAILGMGNGSVGIVEQTSTPRKSRTTKVTEVAIAEEPVVVETISEVEPVKVVESGAQTVQTEVTSCAEKTSPALTLVEVRGKLATLSAAGHAPKIKELFAKFGAKKLTEVPEDKYSELMVLAEEIS